MVENIRTAGFLLSSGGRRAFPPSCSLLSAILPRGLYLSCPPSQRSQPLWMCCSAEQMRRSSSCSSRNCCQTLGFLFQHGRNSGTVKGSGWCPAALGREERHSCHLLTGLATLLLCWWVCLMFFCQQYILLVQSPGQEIAGCSPATTDWSWLIDADILAYSLFLKSTLEKKVNSAQVRNFIICTSGTSAGVQLLIWCHIFFTCELLTRGETVGYWAYIAQ